MALPLMGLCPDSKRGLNFFLLKKNQNPTMLDKGSVVVFSASSGCSPGIVNSKQPKFNTFLRPSFHTKTFESLFVSGFLGSKSQGRTTNKPFVYDFIPDLFEAATQCLKKHCGSSLIPSPPKKKFAKVLSLGNLDIVDSLEFPSVIEKQPPEESQVEGPKQSYAEVAKAPSCKPCKPDNCPASQDLTEAGARRGSIHCRRPLSVDQKSSKRKSKRRGRRGNTSPRESDISCLNSPTLESQPQVLKDLRSCQQEKHFSQLKIAACNRKADRYSNISSSVKRDHLQKEHSEGRNRSIRRSNFRSHCDNKRGTRGKNFDCDIDKINWRTGEPIGSIMGLPYDVDVMGEDFSTGQSLNNSCTEQSNNTCIAEQRKPEFCPSDATSRHEAQNASPKCRRRSLSSECSVDSEDSFIVFHSGAPSDSSSDLASDWSDCDSDDTFGSDSEASEEDDMRDGFYPSSMRLKEVNELWQRDYAAEPDSSSCNKDSNDIVKKVHFSSSKPTIHRMLAWDFAYRTSRPGPWEQMARDCDRFQTRIRQFEAILSPVLTSDHRNKIWNRLKNLQVPAPL